MEKNTIIAFVIIQLILISSFIVIATNENDTPMQDQNDALCLEDCNDCSNVCTGSCNTMNDNKKSCDESCIQSGPQSQKKGTNCVGTCNDLGDCEQIQKNTGSCKSSVSCSGRCAS